MKVLIYVAELQSLDETKAKEDVLLMWAQVNEVEIVGVVSELNGANSLGESGQGAIIEILTQYDGGAECGCKYIISSLRVWKRRSGDFCG